MMARFRDTTVRQRLKELGYSKISDFLASHPAVPYETLAPALSTDGSDVIPVQLMSMHCDEALADGDIELLARDSLARAVSAIFPDGWAPDNDRILLLSAEWISPLRTRGLERYRDALLEVYSWVRSHPPHPGWRPTGPDDPIIRQAFEEAWHPKAR